MSADKADRSPGPGGPDDRNGRESRDSSRARKAVLRHIRHELRTPINAILGYGEMLQEDIQARSQLEGFARDLGNIQTAGKQLLKLISDLLDDDAVASEQEGRGLEAFGAHVRHELRTPINTILGYCEMLSEDAEEMGETALLPDLDRIHTATDRLLSLIDDIVKFSGEGVHEEDFDLEHRQASALVRDAVATIPALVKDAARSLKQGALLLVDDSEMNRDLISRQLERDGYQVSRAENGRVAMEMIREREFDLILLDIMMPEINGFELLQWLKNDENLNHIPVLMISALDELDSVVRCIEIGAEDYLQKPINPILLRARVNSSLEKKRLRDRERAYLKQLSIEQEKSEKLLLNILPKPISDRLKRGETQIADSFKEVTVMFSDLVNFTKISANIPPAELVRRISKIFSRFDQLAERHHLEKIKTIGDAYMIVGGVPTPRADHAEAIADMALDMLEAIRQFREDEEQPFDIRIGIHTGSVVAGIIGMKKFAYDLWGDTVNTASRMESHGLPGSIQVSDVTYGYLKDKYILEDRGKVWVKGKGELNTFLLKGKRGPPDPEKKTDLSA